ncbi:MAG: DNA primase [Bacteroidales bacterium]|jgi:DNA primase|nr:DNA primase [Bacteroidales bacterium]HOA10326.1 DNA primase [Tenuifilaceae bacterium]MBP8643301.1 DNA primase [Bacteroidales bacterium]NLI88016.1 DNA primase [Bacteroidales bacterium]HOC37126.1 DNA primase [Tenuifilaceae bacterium]
MIEQQVVDRIIAAADILEVLQDFVTLRKRGVNYLGLCPFHNEKTPSFTVSPSKGIYKCFGCGKGGNVVNFIMEHEHLGYVDALKFLAKRYNIEIVEKEATPEELEQRNERESLMVVSAYAQKYFSNILHKHSDGKNIGMAYFRERGFHDNIIEKFQLGYSLDQRNAFTRTALHDGYKLDYLVKTGLTIEGKDGNPFDRFAGRVMFPIHSLSGRVIGFGGRVLRTDTKTAKYLNSPESEIYHKSEVLYGIFQAKKAITQEGKCFLVEGYTDVISLHQAGVENVVASSGTSLTHDQIKLIKRFTSNVTILYDGDAAGIKASLRGIDMVLEEGLNVKIVLLPDGEDPDSFARSHSASEVLKFIDEHETDFIRFKTLLLLDDAKNDPIKRANLIGDIVQSISVIPEVIKRSVYIKECSRLMDIEENVLYTEVNRQRRKRFEQLVQRESREPKEKETPRLPSYVSGVVCEEQEKEIISFLLNYGSKTLYNSQSEENKDDEINITVGQYIIDEILNDELEFQNLAYKMIFDEYAQLLSQNQAVDNRHFINHYNPQISQLAVDLMSSRHKLSRIWEKHKAEVTDDPDFLLHAVPKAIQVYKSKVLKIAIKNLTDELTHLSAQQKDETDEILKRLLELNKLMNSMSKGLDRVVL